jgi:GNAT superfamily N-acetyltransferase
MKDKIIVKKTGKNKIIAYLGKEKAGSLTYFHPQDAAGKRNIEFDWLYVYPKHRRKGVATAIIKYFIAKYKNKCVWLSFWTGKDVEIDKSHKLYTKLGFKEKAHQEDYYEKGLGTRLYVMRLKK